MDMKSEQQKTPPAFDLRDVLREVLANAREESAQESGGKPKAESQRQPNQP